MSLSCLFGHKDETLAYGYPAYELHWLTINRCKRCGRIQPVVDDLFAPDRESAYSFEKYPINVSLMQTDGPLSPHDNSLVKEILKQRINGRPQRV